MKRVYFTISDLETIRKMAQGYLADGTYKGKNAVKYARSAILRARGYFNKK